MGNDTTSNFRVFIASPDDVRAERDAVRTVLEAMRCEPTIDPHVKLDDVSWDRPDSPLPPDARHSPQRALAAKLTRPKDCDLTVVILWSRMGTPVDDLHLEHMPCASGTEWEFLDAKAGEGDVWVYRCTAPPPWPESHDAQREAHDQHGKVLSFFEQHFRNSAGTASALYSSYGHADDFPELFTKHLKQLLAQKIQQRLAGSAPPAAPTLAEAAPAPAPDARPPKAQRLAPEEIPAQGPYPGLSPYSRQFPKVFVGREEEVDRLFRQLALPQSFLPVLGPSGAGKSSLIEAGLVPRLRAHGGWRISERCLPGAAGADPFRALAVAIKPMLEATTPSEALAEQLRRAAHDEAGMEALRRAWPVLFRPHERRLWVIDQGEEIITLCDAADRAPFARLLARFTADYGNHVIYGTRVDFVPALTGTAEFARLFQTTPMYVNPPGERALCQIIEEPAKLAGASFEEALAARIQRDAGSAPGVLPLLAFMMEALWQHERGKLADGGAPSLLTHGAYEEIGQFDGAIARQATAVEAELATRYDDLEDKRSRLFSELVTMDAQDVPTRRRSPWPKDPDLARLAGELQDARLLTTDPNPYSGERVVEVAHEALFSSWPTLAEWIDARTVDLSLWNQLERDALRWQARRAESNDEQVPALGADHNLRWHRGRAPEIRAALRHLRGITVPELPAGVSGSVDSAVRDFVYPEGEWRDSVAERVELRERVMDFTDPDPPGMGIDRHGFPDIDWVPIEGGELTLEGVEGSFSTPARYWLGRYPVTYAQYRAFVDHEDGYGNTQWWQGLAEPWRRPPSPVFKERWRPVDGVHWGDAVAFCRWLSAVHAGALEGDIVRLPTEWEWQWVAQGGAEQRPYPWGTEAPDGSRLCAIITSESGGTTPVGLFPGGVSRDGLNDMIGNVWEWCLNDYDDPRTAEAEDASHSRAVRGAAWLAHESYARCALRNGDRPDFRGIGVGFRVCRGSPS